jgi:hypothetical protein
MIRWRVARTKLGKNEQRTAKFIGLREISIIITADNEHLFVISGTILYGVRAISSLEQLEMVRNV